MDRNRLQSGQTEKLPRVQQFLSDQALNNPSAGSIGARSRQQNRIKRNEKVVEKASLLLSGRGGDGDISAVPAAQSIHSAQLSGVGAQFWANNTDERRVADVALYDAKL